MFHVVRLSSVEGYMYIRSSWKHPAVWCIAAECTEHNWKFSEKRYVTVLPICSIMKYQYRVDDADHHHGHSS